MNQISTVIWKFSVIHYHYQQKQKNNEDNLKNFIQNVFVSELKSSNS
jgi:hypothetical protein